MGSYLLAVDQGSTSSRCIVFDEDLQQIATATRQLTSHFPAEGLVEHDPEELLDGVLLAIREAVKEADIDWENVSGLGLAAQTETFVVWDRYTGKAVHPAVSWRDTRAASLCNQRRADGYGATVRSRTGLPLETAFAAPKLQLLLEATPDLGARAIHGDLLFGDVNSWLIWKMSGGVAHVTDASMASRTMLYNLAERCWDPELLKLFAVPKTMLPHILPTVGHFAQTDPVVCGFGLPIVAAAGDQQAGLFGQRCWTVGMAKLTLGTGAFVWANIGRQAPATIPEGVVASVAWDWSAERAYALEGFVPNAGSVINWLRSIGLIPEDFWPVIRPRSMEQSTGLWCVPTFFGLGTPSWEPRRHSHLIGLTADTTSEDICEAALLGIAHQIADAIEALNQDREHPLSLARVDGGLAANSSVLQAISDLTGLRLQRTSEVEITARGCAMLTARGLGWPKVARYDDEGSLRTMETSPRMDSHLRRKARNQWHEILDQTRHLTSDI